MSTPLVSDGLWAIIAPQLPAERPQPKGGRPCIPDRATLTGILFVLKSGIPWEMLPQELGCGSGMTCWQRLCDWQQAGIWAQLHRTLLQRLLRERQGQALDPWIIDCQASGIPELFRFARGLLRERVWVLAGITHPASNGPVEGTITKLKLIKRTMYGRAGFPLLRQRMLHALQAFAYRERVTET